MSVNKEDVAIMVEVNKCVSIVNYYLLCKRFVLKSLQPFHSSPQGCWEHCWGTFRDKLQVDEEPMYFYKFILQKTKQQADFFINPL